MKALWQIDLSVSVRLLRQRLLLKQYKPVALPRVNNFRVGDAMTTGGRVEEVKKILNDNWRRTAVYL
jgi:hypothetical protein